jgi:hypothetical protein
MRTSSGMRRIRLTWAALLALSFTGCVEELVGPSVGLPEEMPADLTLHFTFCEATIPPPSHYEYAIALGPGALGSITYGPDYPELGSPTWTEVFSIDRGRFAELYQLVVDSKVLFTNGKGATNGTGSQRVSLEVAWAEGHYSTGPRASCIAPWPALHAEVRSLVPQEVWDGLESRRAGYMEEHYPREGDDRAPVDQCRLTP